MTLNQDVRRKFRESVEVVRAPLPEVRPTHRE
jgi:hypothetical protein